MTGCVHVSMDCKGKQFAEVNYIAGVDTLNLMCGLWLLEDACLDC